MLCVGASRSCWRPERRAWHSKTEVWRTWWGSADYHSHVRTVRSAEANWEIWREICEGCPGCAGPPPPPSDPSWQLADDGKTGTTVASLSPWGLPALSDDWQLISSTNQGSCRSVTNVAATHWLGNWLNINRQSWEPGQVWLHWLVRKMQLNIYSTEQEFNQTKAIYQHQ